MTGLHITTSERTFEHLGVAASPHVPPVDVPILRLIRDGDRVTVASAARPLEPARLIVHAVSVFVVVLVVGLALFALAPALAGYRPVIVGSNSMAPSLRTADIVVTDPAADIRVGSVIDFATVDGGRIHRVVEVDGERYRTKGDANPDLDSSLVARDQVRGVGVFVVPFIGVARVWIDDGRWAVLAAVGTTIVAAVYCARRRWAFGEVDSPFAGFGAAPS